MSVKTCPKCGALITPQLERCRQCKTYLHGTRAEGWLMSALPAPLRASPGTGLLAAMIVVAYLGTAVLALPASPFGFTSYTLQHVGATHGPSMMLGQWWRLATSIFVHHDIVHLAFNLYALTIVGPLVERLFDRKKMLILYLAAGVTSMAVSHLWYVEVAGGPRMFVVSGGASGAIAGLIGAAWVGALRYTPPQPHIAAVMRRWTVLLAVFGFLVPGVNNAAHAGGLLVGAALARFVPAGLTQTVAAQRVLSVVTGLGFLGVAVSFGLMLRAAHGFPGSLPNDTEAPSVFGMELGDRTDWEDSAQVAADEACIRVYAAARGVDEQRATCELAIRVNDHHAPGYLRLADIEERAGNVARAAALRRVAERIATLQ